MLLNARTLTLVFAFVSAPLDTPALSPSRPTHGSLANTQLCGLDGYGRGTYTAEGITKLCEGLKGSAVTSLECAAAPKCLLLCQRPLTLSLPPIDAAWPTTRSVA